MTRHTALNAIALPHTAQRLSNLARRLSFLYLSNRSRREHPLGLKGGNVWI